jgi:peptide-methionine (S)-S-oxide reductase
MKTTSGVVFGVALLVAAACSPAVAAKSVVIPAPTVDDQLAAKSDQKMIVFAGGCFWGIQAVFQHTKGVVMATSGYAGGEASTATYEQVSTGRTGHAESVQVIYDPSKVTVGQLMRVFFSVAHNPTELDRQGPDDGPQYRSEIFVSNPEQEKIAKAYIAELDGASVFREPIVTKVSSLQGFYPAEDYHQNYATKHPYDPYIVINDAPKVVALKKTLPDLYR